MTASPSSALRIAFFGGEPLAVPTLEALCAGGMNPSVVVTNPDRPKGRGRVLCAPPAKQWAAARHMTTCQPTSYRDETTKAFFTQAPWDVFVVAAYNHILPSWLLTLPRHGTLNVHPSLLPKYRGASPVRSAILADDRHTGVTIMLMDTQVDHGPIIAQTQIVIPEHRWPLRGSVLDTILAAAGGELLTRTLPLWCAGTLTPREQDHAQATYTTKFKKEDGLIDLSGDPYSNLLKIRAFEGTPGTYFMQERNGTTLRVRITDATIESGALVPLLVVPEGKREMKYEDFLRGC